MGACCSCCQDDTTAVKSHIVPMGESFSDYRPAKPTKSEPEGDRAGGSNPYSAQKVTIVVRMSRQEQNAGNFKVGCNLSDSNVVTNVEPDTPAGRSELQVGDQVIELDGEALAGRKVKEVLERRALHKFVVLRTGKASMH